MDLHVGDGVRDIRRNDDRRRKKSFTMVELLVVTGIVGVLTAILAPVAQQAGRKARAVACQNQLRQRGLLFHSVFVHERGWPITSTTIDAYDEFWRPNCEGPSNLLICPMARRYEANKEHPHWEILQNGGCGMGSKFTAWQLPLRTPASMEPGLLLGSYGLNSPGLQHLDARIGIKSRVSLCNVPLFLDSVSWTATASSDDKPPAYEGELGISDIKDCCINRHDGAINGLFLDCSVRRVGLKRLWTLDWSPGFDVQNEWTQAGGVQPLDWPQWMRAFRSY